MKKTEFLAVVCFFLLTATLFFNKTFRGQIPFPADLLVAHYQPWESSSFLGYLPGTYPTKNQFFDVLRQIYPWKTLSLEMLREKQPPLWNPYNFSGSPLLANFQSAVFYPLNIIYLVLPQIYSWLILVILQPFLACFFTYFYARNLGLKKPGAFLTAIAFSYSLFMTVFLQYNTIGQTILWLPLILLSIDKLTCHPEHVRQAQCEGSQEGVHKPMGFFATAQNDMIWTGIFIISLCASLLSGHLQIFGLIYGFVFVYLLFRLFASQVKPRKAQLAKWFLIFFSPLVIGAIQLIPTLELINQSARVSQNYDFLINKLLFQPFDLIRFLAPDFFGNPAVGNYALFDPYPGKAVYIGLIPFILAIFSIFKLRKNSLINFFTIVFITTLFLLVRSPVTELIYKIQLPFISTSSPSNAIFLLSFCLCLLAGFGLEEYLKNPKKLLLPILLTGTFFLLVGITSKSAVAQRNLVYSAVVLASFLTVTLFMIVIRKREFHLNPVFLLILIIIFDLFYFFSKFNSFVPKEIIFPETKVFSWLKQNSNINRFWGYGAAAVEANFQTQFKLFSPDGYDPLYPGRYGEFIQSSKEGRINQNFTNQTRSDAVIAPGYGETDLNNNFYRQKVLDLLGVKYVLDRVENNSTEKTFPSDKYKMVYSDDNGWRIFENLKAAPRVFLVSDYQVFTNSEQFEELFFANDFNPTKTILLEEKLGERLIDSNQVSRVIIKDYQSNYIKVLTQTEGNQLLFLSDTYYPGWRVFVDGQETKILRADWAFRAIVVPAGEHRVIFRYQPQSFTWGGRISIVGIIIAIVFIFFLRNTDKSRIYS